MQYHLSVLLVDINCNVAPCCVSLSMFQLEFSKISLLAWWNNQPIRKWHERPPMLVTDCQRSRDGLASLNSHGSALAGQVCCGSLLEPRVLTGKIRLLASSWPAEQNRRCSAARPAVSWAECHWTLNWSLSGLYTSQQQRPNIIPPNDYQHYLQGQSSSII